MASRRRLGTSAHAQQPTAPTVSTTPPNTPKPDGHRFFGIADERPEPIPIKKVIAYTRVSTWEQLVNGVGLPEQTRQIVQYCEMRGLPIPQALEVCDEPETASVLFEEIESGTEAATKFRKQLRHALDLVTPGTLFLVPKLDRFARSAQVALQALTLIKNRGGRFLSISEQFDTDRPEGKYIFTQWVSMAEMEVNRIKQRTMGGRRYLRAQGNWVEGECPFGYRVAKRGRRGAGMLVVHDEEAQIVREVFNLRDQGYSTRAISNIIEAKHPGVRKWTGWLIWSWLRHRVYIGQIQNEAGSDVWIDAHPPIIDSTLFWRVQNKLDKAKHTPKRPWSDYYQTWLLHTMMTCATCDKSIASIPYHRRNDGREPAKNRRTNHQGYYMCYSAWGNHYKHRCPERRRHRQDSIDEIAAQLVCNRLRELGELVAHPVKDEQFDQISQFQKEIKNQRDALVRIADGYAQRILDAKEAKRLRSEAEKKIEKAEASLRQLRRERDLLNDANATRALLAALPDIRKLWEVGTVPERKKLLQILAAKIILFPDGEIKILWRPAGQTIEKIGVFSDGDLLSNSLADCGITQQFIHQSDGLQSVRKIVASKLRDH